jgi:hypothetical protein
LSQFSPSAGFGIEQWTAGKAQRIINNHPKRAGLGDEASRGSCAIGSGRCEGAITAGRAKLGHSETGPVFRILSSKANLRAESVDKHFVEAFSWNER